MELLEMAEKSPAAKHIKFSLEGKPYGDKWTLVGYPKQLSKVFLKNSEWFYLDIDTTQEDFHRTRTMFAIADIDGREKWLIAARGDSRSHQQWLSEDYGVLDSKILRGYYDAEGLYFYHKDFDVTEEDIAKLLSYLPVAVQMLDLDGNLYVYAGLIKGKIGTKWKPKKCLGTLEQILNAP